MPDETELPDETAPGERGAFRVRMPGFVRDEEIGLGQAIKYVASRAGIRPCGGCERRAAALDRRVVLAPRGRT